MSKIKFIAKQFAVSLLFTCLLYDYAFAAGKDIDRYTTISEEQLKERLQLISSDVELRYSSEVHAIINKLISSYRKDSEVLLGRGNEFFPLYESEFDKAGLPAELKYLSVVESSLIPTAVSKVGAVGLWQFMKGTATQYGLTINSAVDERKDVMRSTQAAVQFLKELYLEFGDWTLALAAYNCGPGGVKKAQRVSNSYEGSAFWDVKAYLPKETRRYIPKFIAVSYVMNYFQAHGLQPMLESNMVFESMATVKVYEYTSFKQLSQTLGLDYQTIARLNPAFLRGYIPKSSKGYYLTLPETKMYDYLAITENWGNLEYRPKASDANMYDVYLYGSMKRRAMNLDVVEQLPSNNSSVLYISKVERTNNDLPDMPVGPVNTENKGLSTASRYKYYKLLPQQSLMDIVDMYDISLEELIKVNGIDPNNPPPPGSVIKIEWTE